MELAYGNNMITNATEDICTCNSYNLMHQVFVTLSVICCCVVTWKACVISMPKIQHLTQHHVKHMTD